MKILWFTWKDKSHPQAGGAETVNEELAARLVADGDEVIFLVGGFNGGQAEEVRQGFKVIRLGNRWTVYWQAYRYYKNNLRGWADLAIDEVNTVPFFCKFYVKERNILFVHQLCREIWFYQLFFPLNLIGYLLESLYLRLLNNQLVITVSKSSQKDLERYGFKDKDIHIIREGIELDPIDNLRAIKKYEYPTLLSLGSIRPMKRTLHILQAFELAKQEIKDLRLMVAGEADSAYGRKFLRALDRSPFRGDIEYLGRVDRTKKIEILQRSHLLIVSSIKEGWGLVVTEANSQGTPALVYDADGLRDSVKNGGTGIVVKKNQPSQLAKETVSLLNDNSRYENLAQKAWLEVKGNNFTATYQGFLDAIN